MQPGESLPPSSLALVGKHWCNNHPHDHEDVQIPPKHSVRGCGSWITAREGEIPGAAGSNPRTDVLFLCTRGAADVCLSLPARKLKLSPLFLLQRKKCVSEREIYTLLSFLEMECDFPVTADAGLVLMP